MDRLVSVKSLFVKLQHNASLILWLIVGSFLMWLPTSFVIAAPATRTYLQTNNSLNFTKPNLLKKTAVIATRLEAGCLQNASSVLTPAAHDQKFLPSLYFKLNPLDKNQPQFLTFNRSNSRDPPFDNWYKIFA